jgi:hypothetical protein
MDKEENQLLEKMGVQYSFLQNYAGISSLYKEKFQEE